jgi:hypothetical protein
MSTFAGIVNPIILKPGLEGKDLWITSVFDYDDNYGVDDGWLKVGGWGDYYYSLIRFDLSNITSGGDLASASLRLYSTDGGTYAPIEFYFDEVLVAWDESYGWYDYGLSYTNIGVASAPATNSWVSIDVTSAVDHWLANPDSNFGLLLRPSSIDQKLDYFVSSDATGEMAQYRPELVLTFASVATTANPYVTYVDPTPAEITATDVRDAARNYVGQLWGGLNCTGLVWAVANAIGAPYYETVSQVAAAAGVTEDQVLTTVPDAADFDGYITPPAEGSYGTGASQWITKEYTDWPSLVKVGDLVRIPKNVIAELPEGHSFIVVGGDGQNGWRVIDNIDPDGTTGVKPIKEHTYTEGVNSLFPKILAAPRAFVSELALPELEIDNLTSSQAVVGVGNTITVGAVVHNYGNVASGAFSTRIYISRNPTFDSTAIPLATFDGSQYNPFGVAPDGVTGNLNMSVTFDDDLKGKLTSGTNYLIVIADYDNQFIDLNRDNNSYHIPITLDMTFPTEPQSTLPVYIGGTATISHNFLWSYDDVSGPAGVTYNIVTASTHGTVLLDGSSTTTFTQADVDYGRLEYRHNGDTATSDGFTFTVSDEAGNTIGPEPFTIAVVDTGEPVVAANAGVTVPVSGTVLVLRDALSAVALGNEPGDIHYRMTAAPVHGALVLSGDLPAPAISFTQADIDNGRLVYVSNGEAATSDSFSFTVVDKEGDQTAVQVFDLSLPGATPVTPPRGWHAVGAGDFDGVGEADILWQHDNGEIAVWLTDGTKTTFQDIIGSPSSEWHAKAVADLNADAKADILWQHDDGRTGVLLMDGIHPVSISPFAAATTT